MTTASIRDLRTKFSEVRQLVETEGEVIVTERGQPRYVLRNYTLSLQRERKQRIDIYKRLVARMPKMLTERQVRAIHEQNRGER